MRRTAHGGAERTITLLTLNIGGPSVERAVKISEYLNGSAPDVIVLTETRPTAGTRHLLGGLADAGYTAHGHLPECPTGRGAAVLSRVAPTTETGRPAGVDLPHRLVAANIGGPHNVALLAAYVPSRDGTARKRHRKQRFLAQMLTTVETAATSQRLILMGDLNVVGRSHEPRYTTFRSWEYDTFDALARHGLVDAFAELHPGVQAHSWIGRTGNGYRYDYAFVSQDLLGAVHACEYTHEPRRRGLSDHAALTLTLSESAIDCRGDAKTASA